MATSDAPLEIGHVALTVRDLDRVRDYYRRSVGLEPIAADGETATLGAGGKTLLELRRDTAARIRSPREAGLFHTAFLLPARADLARWLRDAVERRERVVGASDHGVSEAIYLSDPEGNGIEIYADRPRAAWVTGPDGIEMGTDPLDFEDLAKAGDGAWTGAPAGTVVGHVHLQVGAIPEAEAFYQGVLGMALTHRYRGGSFFGSGGYHHHLATNTWNSRGAGPREYPSTGLAEVVLRADPAELAAVAARAGGTEPRDPWGTAITLRVKEN